VNTESEFDEDSVNDIEHYENDGGAENPAGYEASASNHIKPEKNSKV